MSGRESSRRSPWWVASLVVAAAACGGPSQGLDGDDQDGIIGGSATFVLSVDDARFLPSILKAQNLAHVTLSLTNAGSKPHGFAVGCLNDTCFPEAATILPIEPAAVVTLEFDTPRAEGIFVFGSGAPGDTFTGQFIVQ